MPISAQALDIMLAYGFSVNLAKHALKATDSSIEKALIWIANHMDDINSHAFIDVDIIDME